MILQKVRKFFRSFSPASFLAGVICAAVIAGALAVLWYTLPGGEVKRPDSLAALKKISQMEELVRSKYIDTVDEKALTDAMLTGLVSGLNDKYAAYYTREEYEDVKRSNAGMTRGIGITIAQDPATGDLIVVEVIEGMPAEEAGILLDDILIAVNGEDLTGADSAKAAELIKASDDPVTVTVRRAGAEEPLSFSMNKTDIKSVAVIGMMLDNNIGYIQIATFNGLTSEQFAEEYGALREEGMQALIVDLRNNLGGLVSACCDTASQILPAGPIVYEQDRVGGEQHQDCEGKTPIDMPMVLLVNNYTASASEIFAGAVRDYGIATLVGEQTYGKGIEQKTYVLSDGSALKLTTTVYYTPDHEDINGTGITPDIQVELPDDAVTDLQLEKAIDLLTGS